VGNPLVKDACLASMTLSMWWAEPDSIAWVHGCLLACISHGSSGQVSQEQALARQTFFSDPCSAVVVVLFSSPQLHHSIS